MLDLRLGGVVVDGVSLSFNKAHARDPLSEAQAEQVRTDVALKKAEKGVISPDEAAQELGYDSAYDPSLMLKDPEAAKALRRGTRSHRAGEPQASVTVRFDRGSQSYKHLREGYIT